jgi:hypothetical protein
MVVQLPQCAGSVCVLTQRVPQAVVPAGQAHVAFTQVLPAGHGLPQVPQLRLSERRLTQMPLQLVSPGLHVRTHWPPTHELPGAHVRPQAPQFWTVLRGVSQPSAAMPLQSAKPGLHVWITHIPLTQLIVAFGPLQTVPHVPQFVTLELVSTQVPLQFTCPDGHPPVQTPPTQVWPAPHALPQAPQFWTVLRGVSQPSAAMPLQSAKPGLHVWITQIPLTQLIVAFGPLQTVPHVPQFVTLELVSTQVPLQFTCPDGHPPPLHCPLTHV